MITGNTTWTTHEGRSIKLKDLDDTHLANIVYHTKKYEHWYSNYPKVRKYLERLSRKRGLKQEFLDGAPYPYKGLNNKWKLEFQQVQK